MSIANSSFPATRPRRMRRDEFSRRMMRESGLSPADLIQPFFIIEGEDSTEPVPSMPGVERVSVDRLVARCKRTMTVQNHQASCTCGDNLIQQYL